MKICTKCNLGKDESEFVFRNDSQKYKNECKKCKREYDKKRNARPEVKEKKKLYDKQYYNDNIEYKKESFKIYKEENKEAIRDCNIRYRSLPEVKEKINKRERDKRKENPCYRIRCVVSSCVLRAVKENGGIKKGSILKYFPYTIKQLKQHIESLWESWMNWDNYGRANIKKRTWNIDHIIPQSLLLYDSMDHPNFQKCWALSNLRPLEAVKNIRKGNKIEVETI